MNLKKNNNLNVPKKKVDKNEVYAIILAILIIFWSISSVFGIIGYARSSKKRNMGMITASADTSTAENYVIRQGYYRCVDYPNSIDTNVTIPLSFRAIIGNSNNTLFNSITFGFSYVSATLSNTSGSYVFYDGEWVTSYSTGRAIYVTVDTPCSLQQYTTFNSVYEFWGAPTDSDYPFTLYFNDSLNVSFLGLNPAYSVLSYSSNKVNDLYFRLTFTSVDTSYNYVGLSSTAPNESTTLMVYSNGSWLHEDYRTLEVTYFGTDWKFRFFLVFNTTLYRDEGDIPSDNPIITENFNKYSFDFEELTGLSIANAGETSYSYEQSFFHRFALDGAKLTYNNSLLTDTAGIVQSSGVWTFAFRSLQNSTYSIITGYIEIIEDDYAIGEPFLPDTGYNVLKTISCTITDTINEGISFTFNLYFDWYENMKDNYPIESMFSFKVTYNLTELYTAYDGYSSLYLPFSNEVLTNGATHTIISSRYSQVGRFNALETVYDNAYNNGYNKGFFEGSAGTDGDTPAPTFFNLISAVIDAPIQAFTSLFNFDLLGVNLTSFFLALLSVAVFIAIIRLIL